MRILELLLISLIASSCRQTLPTQAVETVALSGAFAGIVASAKMQEVNSGQTTTSLDVSVTMWNHASSSLQFVVLANCPVYVRLSPADSTTSGPTYDESAHPCVRSGRQINLAPGDSVVLVDTVPADSLRLLPRGSYHGVATVTAGTNQPSVSAGTVTLPLTGVR